MALNRMAGQPDFRRQKRPFLALFAVSNPHICRELHLKSKPFQRFSKEAEIWVLSHAVGQSIFGRRARPFRALLAASHPLFCREYGPQKNAISATFERRRNLGAKSHVWAACFQVPKAAFSDTLSWRFLQPALSVEGPGL